MIDFRASAQLYTEQGFAVLPLVPDQDGFPKKPAFVPYSLLRPEANSSHDWTKASGLGIVLGRASGNLANIDVDDLGLSDYLRGKLSAETRPPLMVRTARGRLHVYCLEPFASLPVDMEVRYQNRRCLVQLLATGC